MEATREIYWNVGHGVVLPMYILSFAAVAALVWGFWKRLPMYRQGKPLDRFDRYEERVKMLIADVFGQEKIFRVRDGGMPHAFFFWSFLTLFAGTLLVMFQADFFTPLMQVNLLSGLFYEAFSLVLDMAGITAILMLAGLFIRRFIIKPAGLETTGSGAQQAQRWLVVQKRAQLTATHAVAPPVLALEQQHAVFRFLVKNPVTDKMQDLHRSAAQPVLQIREGRMVHPFHDQLATFLKVTQCLVQPVPLAVNIQRRLGGWTGDHHQNVERRLDLQGSDLFRQVQVTHDGSIFRDSKKPIQRLVVKEFPGQATQFRDVG